MSMSSTNDAGFRDIFDNSGSVMLLLEPRRGRIVEANRAALKYYGYRPEQLIGVSQAQLDGRFDFAHDRNHAVNTP